MKKREEREFKECKINKQEVEQSCMKKDRKTPVGIRTYMNRVIFEKDPKEKRKMRVIMGMIDMVRITKKQRI